MSIRGSITRLLSGVKKADAEAACDLLARCYARVADVSHRKLAGTPHRGFGTDDVANSAFCAFLVRAAAGDFPRLENREDVWQVLTLLVKDAIVTRLRNEGRQKRGGGIPPVAITTVQHAICNLDNPALRALVDEARAELLRALPSDDHRRIVELLEEGYTRKEIAEKLGMGLRTLDRRLTVIRSILPRVLGITVPDRMPQDAEEDDREDDGRNAS